jgi:hypothetical protein
MRLRPVAGALFAAVTLSAPLGASDLRYQVRDDNREEGLRDLPTAGGSSLRLLSFIAWREAVRLADRPVLKLRFYLSEPRTVFLTAVELRRHGPSHYQMRPTRTHWAAGWQEFASWPTAAVLQPAQIDPGDLGILARLDEDAEGSGTVAPVIVYADRYPPLTSRYVAHFVSRRTLSKVNYRVANVETGATLVDTELCADEPGRARPCVAGNMPFEIAMDLGTRPAGTYRLVVDTREHGYASGPSQQYVFRHTPR